MPLIVASFPTTRTQLTSIDPLTLPLTVLSLNVARPDEPEVFTVTCSTEAPKLIVPLPFTVDASATRCNGSEFHASAANATEMSAIDRPSIISSSADSPRRRYAKAGPVARVRRVGMAPALGATGHLDTSNTEAGSGERGSYPAGSFKSALENALSLIAAKLSAARFSYV